MFDLTLIGCYRIWSDNVCGHLCKRGFPAKTNQNQCLCARNVRNLLRGRGKFNVYHEIISLQLTVHDTSHYICKQCLRKLQKRRGLRTNLRELDEEIFQSYSFKACKAGLSIKKKAVRVHD